MQKIFFAWMVLITTGHYSFSQNYPVFGSEKNVTITGLSFDAMEPCLSPDENYLFFNSLNGGNKSIYYATRVNDTVFTYVGEVGGVNQTTAQHIDAAPSLDSADNFIWISTRNYPANMDNLHHGKFNSGNVPAIGRIHGNFYIYSPGWVIMDQTTSYDGKYLYYNNAYFNNCSVPCEAKIGIAQKLNDSTYYKISNTDTILKNVNDTSCLVYAPFLTKDGLELYYTRMVKGSFNTEICVSVRNTPADTFSAPLVIYSDFPNSPEAATLDTGKQKMYYHKKIGGIYKIVMRYRLAATGINETNSEKALTVFPNPVNDMLTVNLPEPGRKYEIEIYSSLGNRMLQTSGSTMIALTGISSGIYMMVVKQEGRRWITKIAKQ